MLENKSLIIDFGMCLRIPYSSDVRHLITPRTVRIYCDLILFLHFLPFLSPAHNIYRILSLVENWYVPIRCCYFRILTACSN